MARGGCWPGQEWETRVEDLKSSVAGIKILFYQDVS